MGDICGLCNISALPRKLLPAHITIVVDKL